MIIAIEHRLERFSKLSNNKWYYLMNYVIDNLIHTVRYKGFKDMHRYKPDRCFYAINN